MFYHYIFFSPQLPRGLIIFNGIFLICLLPPRNFKDEYQARSANFSVTHAGHCGACSYLQDLGVYLRYIQDLGVYLRYTCSYLQDLGVYLRYTCSYLQDLASISSTHAPIHRT
jgi:hypothetical protein